MRIQYILKLLARQEHRFTAQAQMVQMQQPAPQRRLRRSAGAPVRRSTRAAKAVALALVRALLGIAVVYGAIFLALFRQQF